MDRFPGADTNGAEPGTPIPITQGAKFIKFIQTRSKTGVGILEKNKSINLKGNFGSLDWWKRRDRGTWEEGKSHPHFVLPDWLAATAIAREFRDDFVRSFANDRIGNEAADRLGDLYDTFKTFNLWSMEANVLSYIRATEKLWTVPDDAREFIVARAERSQ